ncbi:MAG: hypothetical protein ACJ0KI_08855 [Dehalococcoidia bacterium]
MPSQEILILSYIKDGSLEPSGFDLLNPAAEMANQNGMKVSIAVLGTQDETIAQEVCFPSRGRQSLFHPE